MGNADGVGERGVGGVKRAYTIEQLVDSFEARTLSRRELVAALTAIAAGTALVAGVMTMGPGFPEHVPTHWLPYFVVADAAASAAECERLGGGIIMPPFDTPMGPMAVLRDTSDAVFAIGAMTQIDDPNNWPA